MVIPYCRLYISIVLSYYYTVVYQNFTNNGHRAKYKAEYTISNIFDIDIIWCYPV